MKADIMIMEESNQDIHQPCLLENDDTITMKKDRPLDQAPDTMGHRFWATVNIISDIPDLSPDNGVYRTNPRHQTLA